MYYNNRKGRIERKQDLARLWELWHTDDVKFSESLGWFGQKAIDGKMGWRFEIMFQTYQSLLIEVDALLFLKDIYYNERSKHLAVSYHLLFTFGYAERITELILGALNLYRQVQYQGNTREDKRFSELAKDYSEEVSAHLQSVKDGKVTRDEAWRMVRYSLQTFASLYDIVERIACCAVGIFGYRAFLKASMPKKTAEPKDPMLEMFERLSEPRRYYFRKLAEKCKPKPKGKKNKRKKLSKTPYDAYR